MKETELVSCSICSQLPDEVEINWDQDDNSEENFTSLPRAVDLLKVPNAELEEHYRYKSERLLQCPECSQYYYFRRWAPGGSEDVLHTTFYQSVRRISLLQAYKKLKSQERDVEYWYNQGGGEYYRAALDLIRSGIHTEERFLVQHRQQLIDEINQALVHKHDESEKLEQEARSLGPDSYLAALARHTRKVEEQDADLNAWLLKYFSEF